MMIKLKEQVTRLVDFELDMANKEHGERFNSAHEAYAVYLKNTKKQKKNTTLWNVRCQISGLA